MTTQVAYITDIEGQWHKLVDFARDNPLVSLEDDALVLHDDAIFVFGGDVIDRGPHARKLMRTFMAAKQRYKQRVILLGGNRDINKLRLWRELQGHIPYPHPDVKGAALLQWLFKNTMNTPNGVEFRQQEIGEDDVVDSFLADVRPGGMHVEYLKHCQLGYRFGHTLFVHGSVTEQNLFFVPEHAPARTIDTWIAGLNAWYLHKLELYEKDAEHHAPDPSWAPLIAYQAPVFPTRLNLQSVVYSRHADDHGNPLLPDPALRKTLTDQGITRVVVGHSPAGDVPALLRSGEFQWLLADNSYSPLERGSRVLISDRDLRIAAHAKLPEGNVRVDFTLDDKDDTPIGLRVPESRYLVKAPLGKDWLLGRHLPKFQVDQIRATRLDALEEPA